MEYLREAGEKLCKYELEKRHAIEYEDYERANYKKGQMDDFRSYVYRQCNIDQLLEKNGVRNKIQLLTHVHVIFLCIQCFVKKKTSLIFPFLKVEFIFLRILFHNINNVISLKLLPS